MGATGSKYNKISSSIQSPLLYLLRFFKLIYASCGNI